VEGGSTIRVPVTLETIPIFVRSGAFLFRQPVVQNTGQMPGQPLIVGVYPAAQSDSTLYEDDGATLEYKKGAFARRRFAQKRREGAVTIEVGAAEGSYRPQARSLELRVLGADPKRVLVGAEPIARVAPERLAAAARGWTIADGAVVVKLADRFDGFRVAIER
jgi:alpha-glucosidase